MEIILMTNVENLGNLGDIVNVKPGYARNYLLPYGKAQPVTPENLAELEARKAKLEEKLREERAAAQVRVDQVQGKVLATTVARANSKGEIDGSIGTFDIVKMMQDTHSIEIERSQVRLPEGALQTVGTHEVPVHFHADLEDATIYVNISSETIVDDTPEEDPIEANTASETIMDDNSDVETETEGSQSAQPEQTQEEDGSGPTQ